MIKEFNPTVSIEDFAAFLDGNLTSQAMQRVSSLISDNEMLSDIMDANDLIDEDVDNFDDDLLAEFDNENISIPNIDEDIAYPEFLDVLDSYNVEIGISDEFSNQVIDEYNNPHLSSKETTSEFELNELNIFTMAHSNMNSNNQLEAEIAARKIFGEEGFGPEGGLDPIIYQGPEGVCAIRSQQIILRDYGIDVSLEELKQFAIQNGWYNDGGGTPMWAIGNLLESCNVHCTQSMDNTVYDLVNELAQGHRVIVGVDANELWADRNHNLLEGAKEWFKDFFTGETPNHALIVAGVEVNPDDPSDIKVILTDPGTGDLRIEYDLEDFMDAWEDSHCFMVSTDSPAPLQYDPETGREVPSNFAIAEYIDTHSLPLNPNNVILPGQMAAMCSDAHYADGHLGAVPVDGHDVDFEDYSAAVAKAQQYKSVIGGGAHLPGQDHFDKNAFVSSLKNMLGLGGNDENDNDEYDDDDTIVPDDDESEDPDTIIDDEDVDDDNVGDGSDDDDNNNLIDDLF